MYKYCYYNNVCKYEDIFVTINNIFLTKVTNNLLNLYRLHMFVIKIIIGKPFVNYSSMRYKYCYYKDKKKCFFFFFFFKIYIVIISIFYSYI